MCRTYQRRGDGPLQLHPLHQSLANGKTSRSLVSTDTVAVAITAARNEAAAAEAVQHCKLQLASLQQEPPSSVHAAAARGLPVAAAEAAGATTTNSEERRAEDSHLVVERLRISSSSSTVRWNKKEEEGDRRP